MMLLAKLHQPADAYNKWTQLWLLTSKLACGVLQSAGRLTAHSGTGMQVAHASQNIWMPDV